jgi:hypothetical protein
MMSTNVRLLLAGGAGATLLMAGTLLPGGVAHAQSAAEQLLKQVLPGATQGGDDDLAAAGERACERFAEDEGLDVRRIVETRRSGSNNLEVTLSVEDRDGRFEAVCLYDGQDQEVAELEPVRGARGDDEEVDERLADRARDACEDAAERRDLEEVDVDDVRARSRDTVEVTMWAEDRGERLDVTCLYDDDERQAFLAE